MLGLDEPAALGDDRLVQPVGDDEHEVRAGRRRQDPARGGAVAQPARLVDGRADQSAAVVGHRPRVHADPEPQPGVRAAAPVVLAQPLVDLLQPQADHGLRRRRRVGRQQHPVAAVLQVHPVRGQVHRTQRVLDQPVHHVAQMELAPQVPLGGALRVHTDDQPVDGLSGPHWYSSAAWRARRDQTGPGTAPRP
ncbi:hypothetical protein BEN35_04310 [Streptomyces fradiae]|nr:hypothetical protein BEN35_04310 [Streptomyces fradiae]